MNQENERSELISRLRNSLESRTAYVKSKLATLVPSQIRALRLRSAMPRQKDLAVAAQLHESRISMFETPGMANLTLETLAKVAAAFKVGVIVKFVSFSEMLRWEDEFSQDTFVVPKLDEDRAFLAPPGVHKESGGAMATATSGLGINGLAAARKKGSASVQGMGSSTIQPYVGAEITS
jgi:hypothetical protein